MSMPKIIRFFVALGIIFATYVCYALVMMNEPVSPWWNFAYGILFSVCVFCAWGM